MPTTVVNRKHTQIYDVYIGRPTLYGNPFRLGTDGDRATVITKFRVWFFSPEQAGLREIIRATLTDKVLGCWCAPQPCHGHVYAEYCNAPVQGVILTCPVHVGVPEPCPTCQSYIAAGL